MTIQKLLANNKAWAARVKSNNPNFFESLEDAQSPDYLWIGCSDSRVPANEIVDLLPGTVFVHRNIANVVVHTDLNCLSVVHYAVDVLKVKHIIIVGHYGCGGIKAALDDKSHGLIDNWLLHIKDVYMRYKDEVDAITDEKEKINRMCELNVIEQVKNLCVSTPVTQAWKNKQILSVHGWCYSLNDGLVHDLDVARTNPNL